MNHRASAALAAMAIVSATPRQPLHAQAPDTAFVLTSNGAISVGSYEAGVDWVMVEMLRIAAQDRAWRRDILGSADRPLRLAAAAGASAGNINSVLSALTYCAALKKEPLSAPASLFWKVWVGVGIEQLFPGVKDDERALENMDDPGPFSRAFFKDTAWKAVTNFRGTNTPAGGCHIPVGFTLTAVNAIDFVLDETLTAPAQRVVTIFEVGSGPDGKLQFLASDSDVTSRRSFGPVALLPELYNRSPQAQLDSSVLNAMEGGSAVPPAFAPRWVCYKTPAFWSRRAERVSSADPICHRFTDGGVFDNNPFALGFDLAKYSLGLGPANTIVTAFSDPYRLRYPDSSSSKTPVPEDSTLGLGYFRELATSFLPAGRKYELQSFERFKARIEESPSIRAEPRPAVFTSSRARPIVGTQFNSFGAFLGRPFREFDFYLGVYDGLRLIAEALICRPAANGVADSVCARSRHANLIKSNALRLDAFTLAMLGRFGIEEGILSSGDLPRESLTTADSVRMRVLEGIRQALPVPPHKQACEGMAYVQDLLCSSGFQHLIDGLSHGDAYAAIDEASRDRIECAAPAPNGADCFVDESFLKLTANSEDFIERLLEDLLRRAWLVEENEAALADRSADEHEDVVEDAPKRNSNSDSSKWHNPHASYSAVIEAAQLADRRLSATAYLHWQWDPSSVPDRHIDHAWPLFHVLPYSVSIGTGLGFYRRVNGQRGVTGLRATPPTLGWQPSYTWPGARNVSLIFPLELSYFHRSVEDDSAIVRTRLGGAGGVGLQLASRTNFPFGAAVLYVNHVLKEQTTPWNRDNGLSHGWRGASISPDAFVIIKREVKLDLRFSTDTRAGSATRRELGVNVGLVDFNGLLYWLIR